MMMRFNIFGTLIFRERAGVKSLRFYLRTRLAGLILTA